MVFHNPRSLRCRRICVDGCVITDGPKCDFMLVTPEGDEHYVELKGTDVEWAITQLETTIKTLHDDNAAVMAHVVCRSQPPSSRTAVQIAKKRFLKKWRAPLTITERRQEVTLT